METARRSEPVSGGLLPELTRVAALKPTKTKEGLLPTGATGTIVHAYADGRAYEVEFTKPFACLVTMNREDVRENPPAN